MSDGNRNLGDIEKGLDMPLQEAMLTQRATERLLLTRRETRQLRQTLWNNLTQVVNEAVEPLSADRR